MYSFNSKELIIKAIKIAQEYLNLPSKENLKDIDWSNFHSIITAIGLWIILIVTSAFILWLLKAIGLYKMAMKKEDKLSFASFIPYGSLFVMGRIVGKTKLFGIEIEYPEYVLPLLLFTMFLPLTSALSTLLFVIFYYALLYKLYKLKWKGFGTVATIISFFIPFLQPFFLFFIKNM